MRSYSDLSTQVSQVTISAVLEKKPKILFYCLENELPPQKEKETEEKDSEEDNENEEIDENESR